MLYNAFKEPIYRKSAGGFWKRGTASRYTGHPGFHVSIWILIYGSRMFKPITTSTMPYHPQYSYSDGDVWLQAKDGTVFRLHSIILKLASPWFRALLGMPRALTERIDDPIPLAEDTDTIAAAFDIL